jgi:hypothetical protein
VLFGCSCIDSLPGKQDTLRGFSGVRLLIVDEGSRASEIPGLRNGEARSGPRRRDTSSGTSSGWGTFLLVLVLATLGLRRVRG